MPNKIASLPLTTSTPLHLHTTTYTSTTLHSSANRSPRSHLGSCFIAISTTFAADVRALTLPQWMFVTANMVDNGHAATIDFASQWVDYWFLPLVNDTNLDDNHNLILLTLDETEAYTVNNHIFALLLGGAVTEIARGRVESTYCAHGSSLSAVEAN